MKMLTISAEEYCKSTQKNLENYGLGYVSGSGEDRDYLSIAIDNAKDDLENAVASMKAEAVVDLTIASTYDNDSCEHQAYIIGTALIPLKDTKEGEPAFKINDKGG